MIFCTVASVEDSCQSHQGNPTSAFPSQTNSKFKFEPWVHILYPSFLITRLSFFFFFMSGMNMEKVVSFELLNLKSKATVDVVVQKTE